ncbi:hypothetical protein GQR36_13220 [Enterococcus termitis]
MRTHKLNYKNKVLTGLLVATTIFTTAGVAGVSLVQPMNVQAETSSNPVANETSDRSITIYKYAVSDLSQVGDRGDGTLDTTVQHDPLEGIKFTIKRVLPVNGGAALVNPKDQKRELTIRSILALQK